MSDVDTDTTLAPQAVEIPQIVRPANLPLAIAAGAAAALVGALLWALITVVTERELGLVAILVGLAVGKAVQFAGRGQTPVFAVTGAVFALAGCVLGNVLSVLIFYAKAKDYDAADMLSLLSLDFITRLMTVTFDAMDVLFYGIAVYEGYRFSIARAAKAQ